MIVDTEESAEGSAKCLHDQEVGGEKPKMASQNDEFFKQKQVRLFTCNTLNFDGKHGRQERILFSFLLMFVQRDPNTVNLRKPDVFYIRFSNCNISQDCFTLNDNFINTFY